MIDFFFFWSFKQKLGGKLRFLKVRKRLEDGQFKKRYFKINHNIYIHVNFLFF